MPVTAIETKWSETILLIIKIWEITFSNESKYAMTKNEIPVLIKYSTGSAKDKPANCINNRKNSTSIFAIRFDYFLI